VSITVASGNSIIEIPISWSGVNARTACMIRVYRGTSPGAYDKYADIPIVNCLSFFDDGISLSGFVWNTRTPSSMDSINNSGIAGQAQYRDGVIRIFSDFTGSPTVGSWKKDDYIDLSTPFDDTANNKRRVGWRMLSGNVWQADHSVI